MLWTEKEEKPDDKVSNFTQESKHLEEKLLPYDVLGNLAHVKMLKKKGYIEPEELEEIEKELKKMYEELPEIEGEDVHTFVEEKVTEETDAGKKMHTGRSRNDQVVLDTRLLMKESIIDLALKTLEFMENLKKFSEEQNKMVPGYTHQQQAMPSSTGLWASSFIDSLADDLKLLESVLKILDQNPLGGAASYGTSLDIDREMTAELLGFTKVQENSIYAVGSRGKQELMLINCLNHIMLDLQKLSEDIINFSEDQEILDIPEKYCTGSSIMPQKDNPDVLELVRSKAEEINAHQQAVRGSIGKLPSGYNRDTQVTKKHLIEALQLTESSVKMLNLLISEIEVSENFEINDEIFAAYTANKKVEEGEAFREAYKEVKEEEKYEKFQKVPEPKHQDLVEIKSFWKKQKSEWNAQKNELLS